MPTDPKVDPKKNSEANRAGTDTNKNVADVKERSQEDIDRDEQKKQQEDYKARMDYGTKVANGTDPIFLESEDDWHSANQLIAEGLAQLRASQVHMETKNWIELTPEGVNAIQAYNQKED